MLLRGHPRKIGNRGNLKCENYSHVVVGQKIFANCTLNSHTSSAANMDTDSLLLDSVTKVLGDVVKGPIVDNDQICIEKFRKHR